MITTSRRGFDPRYVRAGIGVLVAGALYMTIVGQQGVNAADAVAAPVSQVCDAGGPGAVELTATVIDGVNGCEAADNADRIGPYVTTLTGRRGASGDDGVNGTDGRNGADAPIVAPIPGRDGTNGADATPLPPVPGRDGVDATGIPGPAPACLSEPGQCRGADGRGIEDTQVVDCRLIVLYTDGSTRDAGPVCATDSGPEPADPPAADPPPATDAPAEG